MWMMRGRMVVAVVAPAAPTRVWASRTLMGRRGSRRPMSVGFPARLVSGRVDVDLRRSEDPRVAKHRRQAHQPSLPAVPAAVCKRRSEDVSAIFRIGEQRRKWIRELALIP